MADAGERPGRRHRRDDEGARRRTGGTGPGAAGSDRRRTGELERPRSRASSRGLASTDCARRARRRLARIHERRRQLYVARDRAAATEGLLTRSSRSSRPGRHTSAAGRSAGRSRPRSARLITRSDRLLVIRGPRSSSPPPRRRRRRISSVASCEIAVDVHLRHLDGQSPRTATAHVAMSCRIFLARCRGSRSAHGDHSGLRPAVRHQRVDTIAPAVYARERQCEWPRPPQLVRGPRALRIRPRRPGSWPHPHAETAFGFSILKPDSWSVSRKSIVDALQVRRAERVDDDRDAVELELVVACLRRRGRSRARTRTRCSRRPGSRRAAPRPRRRAPRHQAAHLLGRALGEGDDGRSSAARRLPSATV